MQSSMIDPTNGRSLWRGSLKLLPFFYQILYNSILVLNFFKKTSFFCRFFAVLLSFKYKDLNRNDRQRHAKALDRSLGHRKQII